MNQFAKNNQLVLRKNHRPGHRLLAVVNAGKKLCLAEIFQRLLAISHLPSGIRHAEMRLRRARMLPDDLTPHIRPILRTDDCQRSKEQRAPRKAA